MHFCGRVQCFAKWPPRSCVKWGRELVSLVNKEVLTKAHERAFPAHPSLDLSDSTATSVLKTCSLWLRHLILDYILKCFERSNFIWYSSVKQRGSLKKLHIWNVIFSCLKTGEVLKVTISYFAGELLLQHILLSVTQLPPPIKYLFPSKNHYVLISK